MQIEPMVREMRLVVTATNYAEAVHFYRHVLGLPELADYSSPDGQVVLLDAGRATLGATILADATLTPWQTHNARLEAPAGLQLTLFSDARPTPDD